MLLAVPALVVLAAVPLGALPGRSLLPVSFEGARNRAPKPPGAAPAGDEASKTGPKPRVDHLALACADHDQVDEPAIACRWSKAERKEFASYRLLRSRNADPDDRIVVFHTKDRDKTAFVDETIRPNVTYTYRVEALDDSEKVIARSEDVKATDRSPEPDQVRLACRDADAPKPGPKAAPSDKDAEAIAAGGPSRDGPASPPIASSGRRRATPVISRPCSRRTTVTPPRTSTVLPPPTRRTTTSSKS